MALGEFDVEVHGERATIRLRGEFDLSNVREVEAAAFEQTDSGVRDLCLDLHEVTFMDSTMLNLLVDLRKRLGDRGGEFRIQPNVEMATLLKLTGLSGLFDLVESSD
jgi:anti-anti-sigma factor